MAYTEPSERVATEGRLVQRIRELEAEVQRLQKQLDTAYTIIDTVGMEALWAALTPQEEQ